ncbi:MAG: apolipoprotein N-acyltransferase [Ruminococcaceae bacterium]|nr:apolipoprotein N-acyltransferase [Oscillospiraceae bacterium]
MMWMKNAVRRCPALLLLLSAVTTGAVLIWPILAPLEWVSLVPMGAVLLRLISAEGKNGKPVSLRRMYAWGFLYCFVFQAIVYHWFFYLYPLEFTGMPTAAAAAVVAVACFGLALLHGGIFAAAFPLIGLVCRSPICRRLPALRIPLIAAVWCIFEWMQTQTWIGVPWGRLALGQVRWLPVIQTVSLLGSYLITFLLLTVNLLIAAALLEPAAAGRRLTAALLVFGVNFAVGSGLFLLDEAAAEDRDTITVSAAQGNISTSVKWSGEAMAETLQAYVVLTREAAAQGAELVVWPESTIPYTLHKYPWMVEYIEALAAENGVTLLVGCFTASPEGMMNSVVTVTPDGGVDGTVYSKRHLVPFGEYLPMADLVRAVCPPLAQLQMAEGGDLAAGKEAAVHSAAGVKVGSLICFDSIYEMLSLDSVRQGAEVLAVSTNDYWFSDSAALRQHHGQAVLRAVETRRSVIRAANTGISAVITPRGTVLGDLEPLTQGQITAEVECNSRLTLYTQVGNLLIWLCMAGTAVCLGSYLVPQFWRRNRKGIDTDSPA